MSRSSNSICLLRGARLNAKARPPIASPRDLAPADINAVYPERLNLSARVTAFIDFLERHFAGVAKQGW